MMLFFRYVFKVLVYSNCKSAINILWTNINPIFSGRVLLAYTNEMIGSPDDHQTTFAPRTVSSSFSSHLFAPHPFYQSSDTGYQSGLTAVFPLLFSSFTLIAPHRFCNGQQFTNVVSWLCFRLSPSHFSCHRPRRLHETLLLPLRYLPRKFQTCNTCRREHGSRLNTSYVASYTSGFFRTSTISRG